MLHTRTTNSYPLHIVYHHTTLLLLPKLLPMPVCHQLVCHSWYNNWPVDTGLQTTVPVCLAKRLCNLASWDAYPNQWQDDVVAGMISLNWHFVSAMCVPRYTGLECHTEYQDPIELQKQKELSFKMETKSVRKPAVIEEVNGRTPKWQFEQA